MVTELNGMTSHSISMMIGWSRLKGMRMSIEKQIRDYQLWLDAQDFVADAPRYYANELILNRIAELLDVAESDDYEFVEQLEIAMLEYRNGR